MDRVLADIDVADPTANIDSDEEMADVAPRAVQKQETRKKVKIERKKEKGGNKGGEGVDGEKKKKRKHGEANGEERKKDKKRK